MSRYPIPARTTRVELRVSNSRFIATIARADTTRTAQDFIRTIRAEMPDATHHVYAFKVGYPPSVSEGMSDDGEPSGTAGPPAMAVLRGADLGDAVLVITRYFGGSKLGTGGLVSAYSEAAKAAVAAVPVEEKVARVSVALRAPYPLLEQLKRLLAEYDWRLQSEEYGADVLLVFQIPTEHVAEMQQGIANLTAGRVEARLLDTEA